MVVEATSKKTRVIAQVGVYKNGERVWVGRPEKEFYKEQNQPVSEVDVLSTWKEDIYLILADFSEDESATIKAYVNPMVSWLWTGGWDDRLWHRDMYVARSAGAEASPGTFAQAGGDFFPGSGVMIL